MGSEVKAEKLAELESPTALAFSPTGTLYVTVIGDGKDNTQKTGQLLVFEGL